MYNAFSKASFLHTPPLLHYPTLAAVEDCATKECDEVLVARVCAAARRAVTLLELKPKQLQTQAHTNGERGGSGLLSEWVVSYELCIAG